MPVDDTRAARDAARWLVDLAERAAREGDPLNALAFVLAGDAIANRCIQRERARRLQQKESSYVQ